MAVAKAPGSVLGPLPPHLQPLRYQPALSPWAWMCSTMLAVSGKLAVSMVGAPSAACWVWFTPRPQPSQPSSTPTEAYPDSSRLLPGTPSIVLFFAVRARAASSIMLCVILLPNAFQLRHCGRDSDNGDVGGRSTRRSRWRVGSSEDVVRPSAASERGHSSPAGNFGSARRTGSRSSIAAPP